MTTLKLDEQIVVQESASVRERIGRLRTAIGARDAENGGDGKPPSESAACRRLFRTALPILEAEYGLSDA